MWPLLSRLVHERAETQKPEEEEVFREEFLEHVFIDLFLVKVLGWRVTMEVVRLQDLRDLLSIDWPVLKRTDTYLKLGVFEVLFK